MAQFHVYRLPGGALVLDLQTDFIDLGTRVAAPLIPVDQSPPSLPRLKPVLQIAGEDYMLHTAELAAIPARFCAGPPVADLSGQDYTIRTALDMVFSGF